MATQLLFSDLMAAAAVVASSSVAGPTTTLSSNNGNNSVLMDPSSSGPGGFYSSSGQNSNTNGQQSSTTGTKGNYLEDQRALQLAFELSMLNNNNTSNGGGSGADGATNGGGSNASSLSTTSSLGHHPNGGDMNQGYYLNHQQQQQGRQQGTTGSGSSSHGMDSNGHDYDNVLHHFLGSGSHERALNNLGSTGQGQHYHQAQQHQQQQQHQHQAQQQQMTYDDMTLEKFLLNQNMGNSGGDVSSSSCGNGGGGGDYFNHPRNGGGGAHHQLNHHNASALNTLINGISSINLNNLNGSVHGYSNGSGGGGGGHGNGGMMNETERFKKSQNMTECVPVPSSEHVAEIVGRQGCKIKALRAKTNTYIKTPVRGEEPVFVVTGRKEDVAKAKKEILSAAEHFSLIRASRKPSLTNGSAGSGSVNGGINSMAGSPLLSAASGTNNCLGDIFSSSSSGDDSPSILTKNPIGLTSAAAASAAAGHNQITVQVRVPYRVVGLVVGPKGATIKNIQQQTHTYIVTPSRDKEPIFEVTGAVENVEIARQQIEAHIAMRTGGNSEATDNLTNYLNSINSRGGLDLGMKKELQDELQLLNENFGQSTNFLRKYLNGHNEDQSMQQQQHQQQDNYGGSFHSGGGNSEPKQQQQQQQAAANLAAMELLMSQLYNNPDNNQVGTAMNDVDIPSSVDLFGNRIRIDELLQSMQQQQKQSSCDLKRESDNQLLMGRNLFSADYSSPSPNNGGSAASGGHKGMKNNDYYGNYAGETLNKIGQFGAAEDQGMLRRQLMSNNSEDDEGVGLELQESSPPNTSTNIMKMIMDGAAEENKKYLWSTLSAAVANNGAVNGGGGGVAAGGASHGGGGGKGASELGMGHVNHSSDSSCLSSASPSPTLSKFFTFQNGQNGGGSKDRASQEVELAAQLM